MSSPSRVVFRMSPLGVLAALALAVCATPVAFGAPWFFLIYLLPLGIAAWVLCTRTVVDQQTVTTRSLLTRRRVRWDDIASLRLRKKAKISAVLTDGAELPLPAVRVRDLPVLASASGGRLPDPAGDSAAGDTAIGDIDIGDTTASDSSARETTTGDDLSDRADEVPDRANE